MFPHFIPFCTLVILGSVIAQDEISSSTAVPATPQTQSPQPVYKPPDQNTGYIPHQTYPYADTYGGSLYDGFFYPLAVKPPSYPQHPAPSNYMSAVMPAVQGALQFTLKALAKFGLFLIGGAALLLIGGVFTTAVCYLTPICVISFPAFGGINKESVRSFMTPDKISAAAALVQDAIGKYQRLQRAVPN